MPASYPAPPTAPETPRLTAALATICDFIRYATSRFNEAELCFGHGFDNALDEASFLVLGALHLPHDLPPAYAAARLVEDERSRVLELIRRRVEERIPVAYLLGEAWFAGISFKVSPDVLIPRSPLAELIQNGFQPWLGERPLRRVLDLCCGSGCIGIASAVHLADLRVDLADVSPAALALAAENAAAHGVEDRVDCLLSDGFGALAGRRYDLILANPPYVGLPEFDALPAEYRHEPRLGLVSGEDGLDLPLRILAEAPQYLEEDGLLFLEVGASDEALLDTLPELPATWLDFERGGSGVALIEAAALRALQQRLEQILAHRGVSR